MHAVRTLVLERYLGGHTEGRAASRLVSCPQMASKASLSLQRAAFFLRRSLRRTAKRASDKAVCGTRSAAPGFIRRHLPRLRSRRIFESPFSLLPLGLVILQRLLRNSVNALSCVDESGWLGLLPTCARWLSLLQAQPQHLQSPARQQPQQQEQCLWILHNHSNKHRKMSLKDLIPGAR